ncbi:MAG: hypothetical protein ACR2NN_14560 [Bryobacteraceae bacterium]
MFTQGQAFGLFLLLSSNSKLRHDLNAKLKDPHMSADQFFDNAVKPMLQGPPFNLPAASVDKATLQPLWVTGGQKRDELDSSAATLGDVLSPPLSYFPGPCPDDNQQTLVWNQLTGS